MFSFGKEFREIWNVKPGGTKRGGYTNESKGCNAYRY